MAYTIDPVRTQFRGDRIEEHVANQHAWLFSSGEDVALLAVNNRHVEGMIGTSCERHLNAGGGYPWMLRRGLFSMHVSSHALVARGRVGTTSLAQNAARLQSRSSLQPTRALYVGQYVRFLDLCAYNTQTQQLHL